MGAPADVTTMASFPVEVLFGLYLGILTGIIPAVAAWGLGFVFKYFTGVSIPAFAVVVLSLAIAGASGGLLALADPTITTAPNQVTLTTAIIVVLMISLYAHAHGDRTGEEMPKHLSLRRLRDRTLSSEVVELVGGLGQVSVTVVGEVEDLEGYPPLPDDVRAEIRDGEWTFPADLPISEIESRLADTLRTKFDVADASVEIDDRGRAHVAAAPPAGGVSKRVPPAHRAVSIRALVPTGLARGEAVTVHPPDGDEAVSGTVLSARSSLPDDGPSPRQDPAVSSDGGTEPAEEPAPKPPRSPTTDGGDGRITVAVRREDAERLLQAGRAHVVVRARGSRREFELLSLLRRAGRRIRKVAVGAGSTLAGETIGDAAVRDNYSVGVLAVRRSDGWTLAPSGSTEIGPGDELFVVGTVANLDAFGEVVS